MLSSKVAVVELSGFNAYFRCEVLKDSLPVRNSFYRGIYDAHDAVMQFSLQTKTFTCFILQYVCVCVSV